MNDTWAKFKHEGAVPVTDEFISVENWKINMGGLGRPPKLDVTVDVDLEKEGFVEAGSSDKLYNDRTLELVAQMSQLFSSKGKTFLDRYLNELNGLMQVSSSFFCECLNPVPQFAYFLLLCLIWTSLVCRISAAPS